MTYTSLRFTTTTSASKRTGIFEDLYIFCNKERNKIKGKWWALRKCEQFETNINIREVAITLNDNEIKLKIRNYKFSEEPDFVALDVQYLHQCRQDYLKQSTWL